jgi:cytochrome c
MKQVFGLGLAVAMLMIPWSLQSVKAADNPGTAEFYMTRVQPVLQANCYRCHGGMNRRGGLNIQTREGMLKGGRDGTVLVPGDPAKSLLVRLIRHEGPANDPMPMPPKGKLSDADIALVEQWVKAGAAMPNAASGK